MNRRTFLKSALTISAAALLPIPEFLTPKPDLYIEDGTGFESNLQELMKSLEAGNYHAAPCSLMQGSALQVEDLSAVMKLVTFDDTHIKLHKSLYE